MLPKIKITAEHTVEINGARIPGVLACNIRLRGGIGRSRVYLELIGDVDVENVEASCTFDIKHSPPKKDWIDPEKEKEAYRVNVRHGIVPDAREVVGIIRGDPKK